MQNYCRHRMTDEQRARYKELNWQTAAAKHLELKQNQVVVRDQNNLRQQKCRLLKKIPSSEKKLQNST